MGPCAPLFDSFLHNKTFLKRVGSLECVREKEGKKKQDQAKQTEIVMQLMEAGHIQKVLNHYHTIQHSTT